MLVRIVSLCLLGAFVSALTAPAYGHLAFKKQLEKKYANMKISCNACHVAKKPKTERNEFGKLFAKEFKGQNFSATVKSKKR